jgi:hypothetical protein
MVHLNSWSVAVTRTTFFSILLDIPDFMCLQGEVFLSFIGVLGYIGPLALT